MAPVVTTDVDVALLRGRKGLVAGLAAARSQITDRIDEGSADLYEVYTQNVYARVQSACQVALDGADTPESGKVALSVQAADAALLGAAFQQTAAQAKDHQNGGYTPYQALAQLFWGLTDSDTDHIIPLPRQEVTEVLVPALAAVGSSNLEASATAETTVGAPTHHLAALLTAAVEDAGDESTVLVTTSLGQLIGLASFAAGLAGTPALADVPSAGNEAVGAASADRTELLARTCALFLPPGVVRPITLPAVTTSRLPAPVEGKRMWVVSGLAAPLFLSLGVLAVNVDWSELGGIPGAALTGLGFVLTAVGALLLLAVLARGLGWVWPRMRRALPGGG
ncbi:MAG: hypothetical protein CL878_02430 [Dehalococcoidia bacterium]|nr:hypothetical protein [Dehalococcoidia bacterium]